MRIEVTKLHGCRNDYLFVDGSKYRLSDPASAARKLADRRGGLGSDGLILVQPSESADFRMEMYNADGSRGMMCGNGIRGLAKYVADRGMTRADEIRVDTDAGVKLLALHREGGKVASVTVNMGKAELEGRRIPVDADGQVIEHGIEVDGRSWKITCVGMGNPHAVTFDADPEGLDLERIGPGFASHPFFPEGINTEFIRVDSPEHLTMRVWERGSGETAACGTGACASVVAAALTGRASRRAVVSLPGGDLDIEYREDGDVIMTGPAVEVYSAEVEV